MIPLVCIDVDGTLVGSSGVVAPEVWRAVDAALARGQHLALSTARGAFGASWDMARRLDPDGWHVFHAGGAVVHTGSGDARVEALTDAEVDAVAAVGADHDWVVEFYAAGDYTVDDASRLAVEHAALMGVPFVRRTRSALDGQGVVRVQFVVPSAEAEHAIAAAGELGLAATSATSPIMRGVSFVSVTPTGVTKASGIAIIAAELGVTIDEVMMVGDGHNDLPAIRAVGHPVAMGNAEPEVLAAAAHRVGTVDEHGVVDALRLSVSL